MMKIEKARPEQLRGSKNLPLIKIRSIKNVDMVEMTMDVDDKVMDELVEYGRKVATREDFFRIAFHKALVDSLEEFKGHKPRKGRK